MIFKVRTVVDVIGFDCADDSADMESVHVCACACVEEEEGVKSITPLKLLQSLCLVSLANFDMSNSRRVLNSVVTLAIFLVLVLHSSLKIGVIVSFVSSQMEKSSQYPIYIEDSVMNAKSHGSCDKPVMRNLRFGCDFDTADRICCFNRHYAEYSSYWESTTFFKEVI